MSGSGIEAHRQSAGQAGATTEAGGAAVSVIMSVYNGERYLRAAVESVLNQTYRDFELIVVDDGSTDSTPATLASVMDSRLRIIRQPNSGRANGRNKAIGLARGEFLTFIDADDLIAPEKLGRQVEYLRAHPEIDGVGTWETVIDRHGDSLESPELPCDPESIRHEYEEGRMGLNGAAVMVRAGVVHAVGGYREPLAPAEDFDLWLRAVERYRLACLPEPLYLYRQHPASSSHAQKARQRFCHQLALDLRRERRTVGSDRLQRGEHIEVPEFQEQPGKSSYHQAMARYHATRSREFGRAGHWCAAVKLAVKGWWQRPSGRYPLTVLVKTLIGAVLPFTRPHLDTVRASLVAALGLKRGRTEGPRSASGSESRSGMVAPLETSTRYTGELESTLIRDEKSFAAVADEWDGLLAVSDTPSSFFLSSIALLPFWRTYGSERALTVVLVREPDGELVGAAPFYIEEVGHRLARHRRLGLLGSPEGGADYLDVIARPGFREAVLCETFRCLRRNKIGWDAINLDFILDDAATLGLLERGRAGYRFWMRRKPATACPYAELPPTWDEFVASLGSSTRRGMKYQLNLLRRKFRDVRFELCTDEHTIREMLRLLISHKQARYGHGIDRDYLAWPGQAIAAQRAGYLRFWVLRLDGRPACFWFTFLFGNRVFFQACSYDPRYANLRLGKVMMHHAIRSAIEEGAREYDMKRGDMAYKYHWANGERRILQLNAVRHSLYGAWINVWEYSAAMSRVRERGYATYLKVRRVCRVPLTPLARH